MALRAKRVFHWFLPGLRVKVEAWIRVAMDQSVSAAIPARKTLFFPQTISSAKGGQNRCSRAPTL
jgi:hypothetical protein